MKDHPLLSKTSLAIFAILILGALSVIIGYDNGILSAAIAVIAGLGGYATGRSTKSK